MTNIPAQPIAISLEVVLFLLGLLILYIIVRLSQRAFKRRALIDPAVGGKGLPAPWRVLRDEVEGANRTLNRQVFENARQLFLDHYVSSPASPAALTREYDQDEFLVVVDADGNPSRLILNMLDRYYSVADKHPEFARWFQEGTLGEGKYTGEPILMAARWLCHLVGLRHATVEIFIDPPLELEALTSQADSSSRKVDQYQEVWDRLPRAEGYTLVQVRGMDKFESPGRFDIPCAGHIANADSVEQALRKELREELNLDLEDLDELRGLERYNSFSESPEGTSFNYEHRVLYRARLKPSAAEKIAFADGEVAGLSVFSVAELRELIRRYPERVASGLSDAIGFYE